MPDISEETFEARREAMRTDPAAYRKEFAECMEKSPRNASAKDIEMLARLVNAPADQAVRVSCERFTKAIHDGRITYKQYSAQFRGAVDPEYIRVIQGR